VQVKMVFNLLPTLPKEAQAAAAKYIAETAHNIERDIKADMRGPKSGRTYRRGKVKRSGKVVGYKFHRASAPGEAPARDVGALVNSIHAKRIGKLTYMVYSNSEYARALEFGTRRMAARPFLRPAVRRRRAQFYQRMRAIVDWYGKK